MVDFGMQSKISKVIDALSHIPDLVLSQCCCHTDRVRRGKVDESFSYCKSEKICIENPQRLNSFTFDQIPLLQATIGTRWDHNEALNESKSSNPPFLECAGSI